MRKKKNENADVLELWNISLSGVQLNRDRSLYLQV